MKRRDLNRSWGHARAVGHVSAEYIHQEAGKHDGVTAARQIKDIFLLAKLELFRFFSKRLHAQV